MHVAGGCGSEYLTPRSLRVFRVLAIYFVGLLLGLTPTSESSMESGKTTSKDETLTLPPNDGAWLMIIGSGGGITGQGSGSVFVTSNGDIVVAGPSPSTYRCQAKLSFSDQGMIDASVRAIHPAGWAVDYGISCCDHIGFNLTLTRRSLNGVEKYSSSFDGLALDCPLKPGASCSEPQLPNDLVVLAKAVLSVAQPLRQKCITGQKQSK